MRLAPSWRKTTRKPGRRREADDRRRGFAAVGLALVTPGLTRGPAFLTSRPWNGRFTAAGSMIMAGGRYRGTMYCGASAAELSPRVSRSAASDQADDGSDFYCPIRYGLTRSRWTARRMRMANTIYELRSRGEKRIKRVVEYANGSCVLIGGGQSCGGMGIFDQLVWGIVAAKRQRDPRLKAGVTRFSIPFRGPPPPVNGGGSVCPALLPDSLQKLNTDPHPPSP